MCPAKTQGTLLKKGKMKVEGQVAGFPHLLNSMVLITSATRGSNKSCSMMAMEGFQVGLGRS